MAFVHVVGGHRSVSGVEARWIWFWQAEGRQVAAMCFT